MMRDVEVYIHADDPLVPFMYLATDFSLPQKKKYIIPEGVWEDYMEFERDTQLWYEYLDKLMKE